ncbi:cyclopropane-fatty-acyl-phospholipid synthase [Auriscalpium vulgare]|uniref:Cyclopropane-fatty-acyl-phospholipid synthase n=1 Tax=Auriscalpium vulgare TaxID=40419 RepID=A0ACB8R6C8_9AGAM|nr:cyclopropane-fatty-acyl-phospholipid synthase [Auriscalpium vulgare]
MTTVIPDAAPEHPRSLYGLADDCFRYATGKIVTMSYPPLARLAESAVLSVLKNIEVGQLRIVTADRVYEFPSGKQAPSTNLSGELRVVNDTFWVRVCTMSDLGFAEAYMYGDVECDDLVSVFLIFMRNKNRLAGLDSRLSWLFRLPQRLIDRRFLGNTRNAQSNISAHYDMPDSMFKAFLSEDMCYSSAIFSQLDADLKSSQDIALNVSHKLQTVATRSPSLSSRSSSTSGAAATASTPATPPAFETLHTAQLRKLAHIVRKARILPGHRVLDVGCGWGALALLIARTIPGTQIDGITLSTHQLAHVQGLINAAGLQERVRVHLMDYRAMPEEWTGAFDRVVSVEMVEHVGREFMGPYVAALERVMCPDSAVCVMQGITMPEGRFAHDKQDIGFIGKWSMPFIFPGGFLPSVTFFLETLTSATYNRVVVDSVSNIGPHYARTLREWRLAFSARFDDTIAPALREEHPGVFIGPEGESALAVFKRKWIYYFAYCEVGFAERWLNDHIITFTREGDRALACDIYE